MPESDSEYRVIPYRRELLPEILQLWEESERDDVEQRRGVFEWFTEGNPQLDGRPAYWCLHDGERVVGMHGHMPVIFYVDGQRTPGHMAHDDLLSPVCRGKGLGRVLLHGVTEQATDPSAAMWFNEPNHRSYLKGGWTDVPGFRRFVRFLDAGRLAKETGNPIAALGIRALGPLALAGLGLWGRTRARGDLVIRPVERFDERADELFERLAPGLGIVVARTADYLNWRFLDKPEGGYDRVSVEGSDGSWLGHAIFRVDHSEETPVLRIIDLLADFETAGTTETLVEHLLGEARARGATHVVAAASHPALVRRLRRLGFLANPRPEYHMITNYEPGLTKDHVSDISRWYLTLGDADGDVWRG